MGKDRVVSVQNAPHYKWGQNSDGWHLLKNDQLSVIEESMPPGSFEQKHFHHRSQQLFYILSGIAIFEIEEEQVEVSAGESIHIEPGTRHAVFNRSGIELRFIVISSPPSHGDRINL